jgi:hypothetical protein
MAAQGVPQFTATPTGIGFPSPITSPDPWDTIYVQGVPWVGKVRVKGAKIKQDWDKKHGRGTEGSSDSYVGSEPQPFDVTFYLWTDDHFKRWPTYQLLFTYSGAKNKASPTSIYYPSLALLGINAITCLEIGGVEPEGEDKLFSATVKLRQFRPAVVMPIAAITPNGASATSPPNLPGHPPSPVIQALQQENQRLRLKAAGWPDNLTTG